MRQTIGSVFLWLISNFHQLSNYLQVQQDVSIFYCTEVNISNQNFQGPISKIQYSKMIYNISLRSAPLPDPAPVVPPAVPASTVETVSAPRYQKTVLALFTDPV